MFYGFYMLRWAARCAFSISILACHRCWTLYSLFLCCTVRNISFTLHATKHFTFFILHKLALNVYFLHICLFLGLNITYWCCFPKGIPTIFLIFICRSLSPLYSSAEFSPCLDVPTLLCSIHSGLCGFGFDPECNSVVSHHLGKLNETGAQFPSCQVR